MKRSRVTEGDEEGALGRSDDLEVATDDERASSRVDSEGSWDCWTWGRVIRLFGQVGQDAKWELERYKEIVVS
jgi:hypothetical protein